MIKTAASFDAELQRSRKGSHGSSSRSPSCIKPSLITPPGFSRGLDKRQRSIDSVTLTSHSTVVSVASSVNDTSIPDVYIKTIIEGFGPDADLYKDVLNISRDSMERDIRIAYFKRGREVLAEEGGFEEIHQAATVGDVSMGSKTRFQAVSMAYEIICNPAWKEEYLQHGLVMSDTCSVVSWDAQSASAISTSQSSRVRWNENVEELVFKKDPAENAAVVTKRRKGKKRRPRILLETKGLDEHLAKLDEAAEEHFVNDFLDDIEASIDGFLKFVETSSLDGSKSSKKKLLPANTKAMPPLHDDYSVSSELKQAASPFDECIHKPTKWLNRFQPNPNKSKALTEGGSNEKYRLHEVSENGKLKAKRSGTEASTNTSILRGRVNPNYTPETSISGEFSSSSGASSLSTTVVETMMSHTKNRMSVDEPSNTAGKKSSLGKRQQHEGRSIHPPDRACVDSFNEKQSATKDMEVDSIFVMDKPAFDSGNGNQNEEDIFAGLEEEDSKTNFTFAAPEAISVPANSRLRSVSPAASGFMSDLSESVITTPEVLSSTSLVPSANQTKELGVAAEIDQVPNLIPSPNGSSTKSGRDISERDDKETVELAGSKDDGWCDPDSFAETFSFDFADGGTTRSAGEEGVKTATSDDDGFIECLAAYISALANDCSTLGAQVAASIEWDKSTDSVFYTCIIPDGDLDCMLEILRREMNRTSSFIDSVSAEVRSY